MTMLTVKGIISKVEGVHWTPVGKDNRPDYASKEETRKPGTTPVFIGKKP